MTEPLLQITHTHNPNTEFRAPEYPKLISEGSDIAMTEQRHGHPEFFKVLDAVAALHEKKNKNYAGGKEKTTTKEYLSNFYNAGPVQQGRLTPQQYLTTLVAKQEENIDRCVWEGDAAHMDTLLEHIEDKIVYAILLLCIIKEEGGLSYVPT
jgi:hypothetical protein